MKKNVIQMKPAMKTPVTYYGGKQRMLSIILPMIPEHQIFVEPFVGGGAVFFAKEPARVELINDKNGEVVNFYKVVKTRFNELKVLVDATLHSEKQQKEAKHIYFHPDDFDEVRRAWALWVLSHQSFYSILGSTWKCGKGRNTAVQLLGRRDSFTDAYCARLERTSIFCRDALDVIRKADHEDAFHYVDPPYFNADMGHYAQATRSRTSQPCSTRLQMCAGNSCCRRIRPTSCASTAKRTDGEHTSTSCRGLREVEAKWKC